METNIGTAATDDLRDKSIKSDIKKSFMKECFNMVVDILTGLQERSPLKCSILRNASAISPVNMVSKKEDFVLKFQGLVDTLYRKIRLNAKLADSCKQQYDEFRDDSSNTKKSSFSLIIRMIAQMISCSYIQLMKRSMKTYFMYVKY